MEEGSCQRGSTAAALNRNTGSVEEWFDDSMLEEGTANALSKGEAISCSSSLLVEKMKALNGSLVVETCEEVEEVGEVILEDCTRHHAEAENPLQVVGMDLRFLEDKTRLVTELERPNDHALEEEEEKEASARIFSLVLAAVDKCDNLGVEFQQVVILQEERVCIFASAAVAEDRCNTLVLAPTLLVAAAESKLDNLWALEALMTLLVLVWSGS